jgi:hypothetical protein
VRLNVCTATTSPYPDSTHGFLFQHHAEFAADAQYVDRRQEASTSWRSRSGSPASDRDHEIPLLLPGEHLHDPRRNDDPLVTASMCCPTTLLLPPRDVRLIVADQ